MNRGSEAKRASERVGYRGATSGVEHSLSLCVSIHGERFVGKLVSAACAGCWHGVGVPYTLVVLAPPVSTAAAAADV